MFKSDKKNNFLLQGAILAIASIISRVIGLIYKVKVIGIIGDLGGSYYACSFEIYSIALIISSYSLPTAVSKLISVQYTKDNNNKIMQLLKVSLILALVSGAFFSIVLYAGADFFTNLMSTPYSRFSLRVLSPALVIVALLGVIRGFFQGIGTTVPSAFSQVLEQLVNAVVSIWASYVLFDIGKAQGAIVNDTDNLAAAYGAAGSTLGTNIGSVAALIFMLFILGYYLRKNMNKDCLNKMECDSTKRVVSDIVKTIFPILIVTTVYNVSGIIDQGIYKWIATDQGYSVSEIHIPWGIYSCKYKLLINLPISIASAFAAASVASVAASYTRHNMQLVKDKISNSIRIISVISFPCMIGLMVLAKPVLVLLFADAPQSLEMTERMLILGGAAIVFFSYSTITNALLQGIDRFFLPVRNSLIALAFHIVLLVEMMRRFKLGIYAVVYANIILALLISLLNTLSICKNCNYHQELSRSFIKPFVAAGIMGIIVWVTYKASYFFNDSNMASLAISIMIGGISYFLILVKIQGVTEEEIVSLPKGLAIQRILKKLRIMN
ncbi:MAG: polysaccharide biosynthesis protein [Agathobacter sp.]|nr:polysaccharide biosynthesis protein [Agathobacter sp.]